MAITQIIATLPAVLNDSATFYEDIAERNNSLVTTVLPSINAWATQANLTQTEINAKALQVAAQAVNGGYSQDYINTNFIGVNNAQTIAGVKTFSSSPIVPTPTIGDRSAKVATMQMFGNEFLNSLGTNGYQKLPSGLIIQWGSTLSDAVGFSKFIYPIAFPKVASKIIATAFIGSGSARFTVTVNNEASTNQSATVSCWFGDDQSSFTGQVGVNWLVIGY